MIMNSIADNIRKDFTEFSKRNKYIQQLIEKLENRKATLSEVDAITRATGYALKVAFVKNISENASAFADEDMLAEILCETFGDNYDMINAIAADVQKCLDKTEGINIRPQKADFPNERVKNLARFAAGKDLSEEKTLSEFGASLENLNDSMFTDYVEANAKFRSEAGLRVYIIRSDSGRCCDWCAKLVGKYIYPDVPKDVWRRHKRCTCEITYVNERIGTADRIRFADRKDGKKILTNKQVTRLTPEQARAKEREVTAKNPLTFGRRGGIIKENNQKTITEITDKAVEKVPNVKIHGYTDEQCRFIQEQHKDLLRYSHDNNENKEVAFVFDNSLTNRKEFLGEDDRLDFGNELYGNELFVMHNHPRNSSYSDRDIRFIVDNDNIKSLSIIKNNGNVEVLTKTNIYDKNKALVELKRCYKKYVRKGTDEEIDKAIMAFVKNNKGLLEWIKK